MNEQEQRIADLILLRIEGALTKDLDTNIVIELLQMYSNLINTSVNRSLHL